jgi:hypothetical protein
MDAFCICPYRIKAAISAQRINVAINREMTARGCGFDVSENYNSV